MPGPFDYAQGIGRFHGVGKFDALNGVHVGAGLRARLTPPPARIAFVNDAAAFGLGEWLVGAARDATRALAITLGTGIGSAFVDDGRVVESGDRVPPDGHVYRLVVAGQPLEQLVSRRAMLARYRAAGGGDEDVAAIAARARAGEATARAAFVDPLKLLGRCLAPWLLRFDAPVLVVGGAMSASWELVEQALRAGLAAAGAAAVDVRRASDPDSSTAAGAAWHAVRIDSARREVRGESPDEKR
jgi:glucokinase